MNLVIPRNNLSGLVLYIWKIIDLPKISKQDLLYKISFELFLMIPEQATIFIDRSIKSEFLLEDHQKNISLNSSLKEKLKSWQSMRKDEIIHNIEVTRKDLSVKGRIEEYNKSNYGVLLTAFSDKGTLNRAISVTDDAFVITRFDFNEGLIKAKVKGSQKEAYNINIDINKKELIHNCHDFVTKRAKNKQFCKHLAKLFLILKERDEDSVIGFLKEIALNIDAWSFIG